MKKNLVIILLICGFFLANFSFAQNQSLPNLPQNLEETKKMGEKAIEVAPKEMPGILERIWKEEVLPVWQRMYDWFKENIWQKVSSLFKKEIEKRKPQVQEEFKEKKQELKEELPGVTKSLWEKLKDLWQRLKDLIR